MVQRKGRNKKAIKRASEEREEPRGPKWNKIRNILTSDSGDEEEKWDLRSYGSMESCPEDIKELISSLKDPSRVKTLDELLDERYRPFKYRKINWGKPEGPYATIEPITLRPKPVDEGPECSYSDNDEDEDMTWAHELYPNLSISILAQYDEVDLTEKQLDLQEQKRSAELHEAYLY